MLDLEVGKALWRNIMVTVSSTMVWCELVMTPRQRSMAFCLFMLGLGFR
jgi:hypothetical protein